MTTEIVGPARPSPLLCTLLATPLLLAFGACEIAPELLEDGKLSLAGAGGGSVGGAGGSVGSGGRAGQAGTPDKEQPPSAGNAGSMVPPNGGGANSGGPNGGVACTMREGDNQVCVVCTDAATGKVVREGCSPAPVPGQMPDCHDVKRGDGSICTVCFDPASGQNGVAKVSCRPTAGPCGQPTPPPPMGGISCRDYVENGAKCTICFDASGKVVRQGCDATVPMPAPDPGMQSCKEYEANGAKCVTCYDAKGNVVREGCWGPTTPVDPTKPNG